MFIKLKALNPMKHKNNILIYIIIILIFFGQTIVPKTILSYCSNYTSTKSNIFIFFWGSAEIAGIGTVQAGDKIRAFVKSVELNGGCIGFYRVKENSKYGSMPIYGDDKTTDIKDGAAEGDTVYFTICHDGKEYICKETYIWDSPGFAEIREQNLTGSSLAEYIDEDSGKGIEFTEKDALCAFQTYLGICPNNCGDCSETYCNVDENDWRCTPKDALCIFRKSLGLKSCLDKKKPVFY